MLQSLFNKRRANSMKKMTNVKAFLMTCCAVGVLTAANQSWADSTVTNCAQVSAATESDVDSVVNNMVGTTVVEDDESCAPVTVEVVHDFGDAPDSYGTKSASSGAQQEVVPWLQLGATTDDETDAPATLGTGADADGTDEDGVNVADLVIGQKGVSLVATASNSSGADAFLGCWIDYNKNGTFDASEYGAASVPNGTTTATPLSVTMPDVPTTTTVGDSYVRCRLSAAPVAAANATGPIADLSGVAGDVADGEVEDYKISFTAQPTFDVALRKILKTGQAANVSVGDTVAFTIEVLNQGAVEATNIIVTDYIPTGLTLSTASEADWVVAGGVATLKTPIATLAAGASTTVEISFTVGASAVIGELTNTAEISAATGVDGSSNPLSDKDSTPDTTNSDTVKDDIVDEDGKADPANDEDDHDIAKVTIVPKIDVELIKTVTDEAGTAITTTRRGQTVKYTLAAINKGPNAGTGVVVTDVLPAGLEYVAPATPDASVVYDSATRTITWTIGAMAVDSVTPQTKVITAIVK
jgi:uncharacterized repeat protein (TIGR01451 family)